MRYEKNCWLIRRGTARRALVVHATNINGDLEPGTARCAPTPSVIVRNEVRESLQLLQGNRYGFALENTRPIYN